MSGPCPILLLRVGTKETQYAQAETAKVHSITRSLDELFDPLGGLDASLASEARIGGLLELARFAQDDDLPGEARLLFEQAWAAWIENSQQ